jgi:hypothetical protein
MDPSWFNYCECVSSHLTFEDAAELIALVLERPGAGYRQYFPAQAVEFEGHSAAEVIRRFYPDTPLKQPLEAIRELIDVSDITRDTGWRPSRRIVVQVDG